MPDIDVVESNIPLRLCPAALVILRQRAVEGEGRPIPLLRHLTGHLQLRVAAHHLSRQSASSHHDLKRNRGTETCLIADRDHTIKQ